VEYRATGSTHGLVYRCAFATSCAMHFVHAVCLLLEGAMDVSSPLITSFFLFYRKGRVAIDYVELTTMAHASSMKKENTIVHEREHEQHRGQGQDDRWTSSVAGTVYPAREAVCRFMAEAWYSSIFF